MQPLSLVKPVQFTEWGDRSAMSLRPEIAVKVAQCIAHWSEIETMLGIFLGFLLHANEDAILAMYAAVDNRAAQLRMISSAANAALPRDHADVISVLMTAFIRPAMKYRDKLAHWCWGYSDELPDCLLIRDASLHRAGFALALKAQGGTKPVLKSAVPTNHTTIFVITGPDLDRFLNELSYAELQLRTAMATVWISNTPEQRVGLLQRLSNEPRIQAGLTRLRKGHQNNQDIPPQTPPSEQSGEL
jgi:hypothetical protein